MLNRFKVIDYITRKRKICRDLMIYHKIPQYCFDYLYIRKRVPEDLDITLIDNIYRIYCKGRGYVKLFICDISVEEVNKTDEQIKQDILNQCLLAINNHTLEKQRSIDSLNDKLNVLINKKLTLIDLLNENLDI